MNIKSTTLAVMFLLGAVSIIACSGTAETENKPSGDSNATTKKNQTVGDRTDAIIAAQEFVRRFLNHPNNSSFGWEVDANYRPATEHWSVTGSVDAMNAFGTMITHNYKCSLALRGSNWTCVKMSFDGELAHVDGNFIVAEEDRQKRQREAEEREQKRQANVKRIEEAKERIASEQEADPQAFAEKQADTKLSQAKNLLINNEKAAKRRLDEIIKKFPDTDAAAEAKKIIAKHFADE